MVSIKALLILVVFTISYVSAEDCGKFFKVDSKPAEVSETCAKELKLDPTAAPKTEEEFKKDFDDKCFGKCFMEKMKMAKDGKFDKDAITADVKAHVSDEATQKKVLEYTLKCIDESDAEKDACKKFARFLSCSLDHERQLQC